MKQFYKIGLITLIALLFSIAGYGQVLLEENFDYTADALLTSNGWSAHSGAGSQPITVVSPGLSFTDYASSGIGNAALLDNTGEDVNIQFTSQTSGTLYYSFLIKVDNAVSGYFLSLGTGTSSFASRIFVKPSVNSGKVNFGLSNTSTGTFGTTDFDPSTTYLVVLKYDVSTTGNGSMWVIPTGVPLDETAAGTPEVTATASGQATISGIYLRQYTSTQNITLDGIRVATSWADLLPSATPDETAPAFIATYPNVSAIVADGFNINVQLDEPGTFYYAVVDDATTPPTSEEVKTGTGFQAAGSGAVANASETVTASISGLTTGNVYDVYVVAEDDESTPNLQSSVTLIADITPTADITAPTLLTAETSTGAAQSILLTFDEAITATDATGFSVTINAVSTSITGLTVDGSTATLTFNDKIYVGDVVVLNYSTGNVQDVSGNDLGSISDLAVTNSATTYKVADLTALRALAPGSTAIVTGEVVLTYQRSTRNQKYLQDAGAGILIDDSPGTITTVYTIGDGITGLQGTLSEFSGLLQFVPTADPGTATSNGNTITPVSITATELATNSEIYESRVITLQAVRFVTAGTNFDSGADNYNITEGNNTFIFRDGLGEVADFSGFPQPYGRVDITGFGAENGGNEQLIPYTTDAIMDNYAPEFTVAAAAENVSFFSADITFTSDEPGTAYYLVMADQAPVPSNTEIMTSGIAVAMAFGLNTISLTELADDTMYDVYVLATDDETEPNVQGSAVKVDVDTPLLVVDADADIVAADIPIASATLSSISTDPINVFNFKVTDGGATDGFSTFVKTGTIVPGLANTADWMTAISSATLTVGAIEVPLTITEVGMTFDITGEPVEVTNGGSAECTLSIILSSTQTDGSVFQFSIATTEFGWTSDAESGTVFPAEITGVTSAEHTVEVIASALEIDVFESIAITNDFELTVSAVDANGNLDTEARNVTLSKTSGDGNLTGTGLTSQSLISGTYTWTDLQIDLVGEYTFTVDDDGSALTEITSTVTGFEKAGDLFISEYIEGGSNNKAIEIYNNLGGTADLSKYSIEIYGNGSPTPTGSLILSNIQPSLANGEVLVIANSGSVAAILNVTDITSNVTFFNGDDALGLLKNGSVIDVFGEIGNDPGSSWNVAGIVGASVNKTLVRKNTVTQGNPVNLGSFGTNTEDSEWTVYPQDDFNYIGFHVFGEQPFPLITIVETGFIGNFGYVVNGNSSEVTSYSINTEDLTADLVITPPAGFELSADEAFSGSIYTNSLAWTITPVDGIVAQTVYVRFTPPAADGGTYSGDISHESTDATTKTVAVSGVEGAPGVNSLSGVVINEVLYDPNGTFNYDTDGNGTAATEDEFVEIYNTSASPVDISGWQLWDEASSAFFTFPASTILDAGKYAGVMSAVQAGGTLPAGVNGNLTFSVASGMSLSNGGENVALFDPNSNTYVQVKYGATEADAAISGLAGASIVGIIEAWGTAVSGSSLVRSAEGGVTIVNHSDIQGAESASFAAPAIDPNAPKITVTGSALNFGQLSIGVTSGVLTYIVSGTNLTGDVTITAPAGFEVSTDGTNFAASAVLAPNTGVVAETTISVKFTADSFGSKDDLITHESAGASTINLEVTGAGIDDTVISFVTFANCDAGSYTPVSVVGAQTWNCTSAGETGSGYRMSGFAGGAQDNEDWLIGSYDLTSISSADLSFDSDIDFTGPNLELYASTDYSGNPSTATWTALNATFSTGEWTNSGEISLLDYAGGMVYIGFKYLSNPTDNAAQWTLDNILLTETQAFLEVNSSVFNGDFGQQEENTTSISSSFIVNGFGLTENVSVTPLAGYEVSTSSTFATVSTSVSPLSIAPVDGIVDNVTVYVRFAPTAAQSYNGNITIASAGFDNVTIAVTGVGTAAPLSIADELGITVYPNPVMNTFNVKNDSGQAIRVELYSIQGGRIPMSNKGDQYDVSELTNGLYILLIKDAQNNQLGSTRIIKQ